MLFPSAWFREPRRQSSLDPWISNPKLKHRGPGRLGEISILAARKQRHDHRGCFQPLANGVQFCTIVDQRSKGERLSQWVDFQAVCEREAWGLSSTFIHPGAR
jgi:hypothetical protein